MTADGPDAAVSTDDLRQFLASRLFDEIGHRRTYVVSMPAPSAPLETFLGAQSREHSLLWHHPSGDACAAAGTAIHVPLVGEQRMDQLREVVSRVFTEGVHVSFDDLVCPPPRLFVGLAFAPVGNDVPPWQEFGDGSVTLPRWMYSRVRDGRHSLQLACGPDDIANLDAVAVLLEQFDTTMHALESHAGIATVSAHYKDVPRVLPQSIQQSDRATWRRLVESIKAGIVAGRFEKIVAARNCTVQLPADLDDTAILARLAASSGNSIRIAIRRCQSTLVATTPETLFVKRGTHVSTEALAGTTQSTGSEFPLNSLQSTRLMGSAKDRVEHGYVVSQIVRSLEPLAESVDAPPSPVPRKVRNIIHLNTKIEAALRPEIAACDVLEALHPTPAVGGSPTRDAVDFIVRYEEKARGWYTGTFGWIDAADDASFAVVIRSGLLQRNLAYVYTGAGIVLDSDADAEYEETVLKQQPILRALGVVFGSF